MIVRFIGLVASILLIITVLAYFEMIAVTTPLLKHLVDALIGLGTAAKKGLQTL